MKKILLFLIIVCSITMVNAKVITYGKVTDYNYEDTKKIIKEVMKQYYLREDKIQYNERRTSRYLFPEEVTSQDPQFQVCAGFYYNSLRESFGMDQKSDYKYKLPTGMGLLSNAKNFYKNNILIGKGLDGNRILYYENKKFVNSNNKTEHAKYVYNNIKTLSDLIKVLQPGDIIEYRSSTKPGHYVIIYDLIRDDKGNIVDALYLNSGDHTQTDLVLTRIKGTQEPMYHYGKVDKKNKLVNVNVEGTVMSDSLISGYSGKRLVDDKGNIACKEDECTIVRPFYNKDGKTVFNFDIDTENYERSLLRTKYPGMVIEKTVDKLDNNSVYPGDTLEYTIKISNKSAASNSYNSSTKDYKSDATKYGKFIVQETIDTSLVDLVEYSGCTKSSSDKNKKIAITCTVSGLESGKTKAIKYKVKVKDNSTVIDKTIDTVGKVYKDTSSTYITTGVVSNKIIPKLKKEPKVSYSKCYDDNKNKYQGRELINEIYKCAWGNEYKLELDHIYFTNIFKKIINTSEIDATKVDGKYTCSSNYKLEGNKCIYQDMTADFNNENDMREDSKRIVSMILNDYWSVMIKKYNYLGDDERIMPYSWGLLDRKRIVMEKDFKDGDVLVYWFDQNECIKIESCKNRIYTKESGYYAYIYLDGKFVGVNYRGKSNERNEFTYEYYKNLSIGDKKGYQGLLYNGYETLDNYKKAGKVTDSFVKSVLKRANYETLIDKDYYVILRPEIVIAKEQAKVKPTATATAKSSTTRPTIEPTKEPIITNSPTPTSSTSTRTKTYYRGDIDGDGKINQVDYHKMLRHFINDPKLTGDELKRADANNDGKVNPADSNQLSRIFIKKAEPITIALPITVSPSPKATSTPSPTVTATSKPKATSTVPPTATASNKPKDIAVTSIKLNKSSVTLKSSESLQLVSTITPNDATDKKVTYKSSNNKIAVVDSKGKVIAKAKGKATITAKTANGISASCTVEVQPLRIMFVGNSKTYYTMYREFTMNIAIKNGYEFEGKQAPNSLTIYNSFVASANPLINVKSSYNNVKNSYYSFTQRGVSLKTNYETMISEEYKQSISDLKVDYVILQEQTKAHSNEEVHRQGITNIIKLLAKNNPNIKVFIRNTWINRDTADDVFDKAIKLTKEIVADLNKKKSSLGIKNDIQIINDGEIIWQAAKDGLNVFCDDAGHPSYLASYGAALETARVLFNVNPKNALYLPDILIKSKYKTVDGFPYRSGYYKEECHDNADKSCKLIEKEQTQVDKMIELVAKYQ